MDRSAAASVDAYSEYRKIVGNDDGGTMFTPDEYEAYKQQRRREGSLPAEGARVQPRKKLTEQEEMDIYEQRYQARRKAEKAQGRGGKPSYAISLNAPPIAILDVLHQEEFDRKHRQPTNFHRNSSNSHSPQNHSSHNGNCGSQSSATLQLSASDRSRAIPPSSGRVSNQKKGKRKKGGTVEHPPWDPTTFEMFYGKNPLLD